LVEKRLTTKLTKSTKKSHKSLLGKELRNCKKNLKIFDFVFWIPARLAERESLVDSRWSLVEEILATDYTDFTEVKDKITTD